MITKVSVKLCELCNKHNQKYTEARSEQNVVYKNKGNPKLHAVCETEVLANWQQRML